ARIFLSYALQHIQYSYESFFGYRSIWTHDLHYIPIRMRREAVRRQYGHVTLEHPWHDVEYKQCLFHGLYIHLNMATLSWTLCDVILITVIFSFPFGVICFVLLQSPHRLQIYRFV
ncbi:hypothetical protein L917_19882, partial [Phytophthora nicotianae]